MAFFLACGGTTKHGVTAGTQPGAAWPCVSHDEGFTARADVAGSHGGALAWRLDTGAFIGTASPVIAADGTIYVGNSAGSLVAARPDGSLAWQVPLGGAVEGSPAIAADGSIYVAADDARLHVVSSAGVDVATPPANGSLRSSVVLDETERAYFTSERLQCDAIRGASIVCNDLGNAIDLQVSGEAVAIAHGRAFELGEGDAVVAVDGDPRDVDAGAVVAQGALAAVADDGTTFVLRVGRVEAHDASGAFLWACDVPALGTSAGGATGLVGVARADLVYVVASSSITAATPSGVAWSVDVGASIVGAPAVDSEGAVFVGATDGVLRAFDTSGALLFSFAAGGPIRSSPAIGADGTVYFGADDGFLYALR